jgi:hypothetical protein
VRAYVREISDWESQSERCQVEIATSAGPLTVRYNETSTGRELRKRFFPNLSASQVCLWVGRSKWPVGVRIACWRRGKPVRIEIAPLVPRFVCGGVEIAVLTRSMAFDELGRVLFPRCSPSIKLAFVQGQQRIEMSTFLHSVCLDAQITVVATRVFEVTNYETRKTFWIPFSQWDRVIDFKRAFVDGHAGNEIERIFVVLCKNNAVVRNFDNQTRLWELPDKITVKIEKQSFAVIYVDGIMQWAPAAISVDEAKAKYRLRWIKGNGTELSNEMVLKSVVNEMVLTAAADVAHVTVRAPSGFGAELAAISYRGDDLVVESLSVRRARMLLASYYLKVPFESIVLLSEDSSRVPDDEMADARRTYLLQEEIIEVTVSGFCDEMKMEVGRFCAVRVVIEESERYFGIQNVVLTYGGFVLNRADPLCARGIENGARLYAIINPLTRPTRDLEVVSARNAAHLNGKEVPLVFITPDGRPIGRRFNPQITLAEAARELGRALGPYPVAFKKGQGRLKVMLKEIQSTKKLTELGTWLIYTCVKCHDGDQSRGIPMTAS